MGTTNPLGSVISSTPLATFCLLLPGKRLHLSALLFERKFRGRGNKTAALEALHQLEVAGLGKLEKEKSHRGTAAVSTSSWFTFQSCCFIILGVHLHSSLSGTVRTDSITMDMNDILFILYFMSCVYWQTYTFTKEAVDNEKLEELAEKLAQFGVTISQYQRTLHQEEIVAK